MKKILCLIDIIGFGGGAERQMTGLVQMLKQKGYNVDIAVYHSSPDLPLFKEKYGFEPVLLNVKNNPVSKLMAVRRFIHQNGGYDWIIAYKSGPNIIGCLLKLLGNKSRLIVSERVSIIKMSLADKIRFFLYRYADFIIPNSYSQENDIKNRFPRLASKTTTITNFTDTDYFAPAKDYAPNDVLRVLTVARVTPQKNVAGYLEALALLKKKGVEKVHFDWYGSSYCDADMVYNDSMQKKVIDMGLTEMITFHKATMDINKQYQYCDVFCLPSLFEGYPNVICEAMSCGKPIICSRVCDNPYIVSENENGLFFDPATPEDIANCLERMIGMTRNDLVKWGENSRIRAVKLFSRQAFVEKYCKLIEA